MLACMYVWVAHLAWSLPPRGAGGAPAAVASSGDVYSCLVSTGLVVVKCHFNKSCLVTCPASQAHVPLPARKRKGVRPRNTR
mmetsp:Transcript_11877/g.29008  ORF Transcript_11877/g.29008 Transcript_11877/m.29008 type:complete len:82 (-) Transcript_11877:227-472(-)